MHFFRNAIAILQRNGHKVLVTANDKDVALDLLRAYGILFKVRGHHRRNMIEKLVALPKTTLAVAKAAQELDADILAGINNPYVAEAARIVSRPSVIFDDTEWARWINLTTFPFATLICTPSNFRLNLGAKQIRYDGYHELAYVHPAYHRPNAEVGARLSGDGRPYLVLRLIAWTASHDQATPESPLTSALRNGGYHLLSEFANVWIVSERELPPDLAPARYPLHPSTVLDAIAGSAGYLGEGATMATEAALMGRPSVFVSDKRFGGMDDIERRFHLLETIQSPASAVDRLVELVRDPATSIEWRVRREKMLHESIDVTRFIATLLSNPGLVTMLAQGGPRRSIRARSLRRRLRTSAAGQADVSNALDWPGRRRQPK